MRSINLAVVLLTMLVVSSCTIRPRIYLDGQPILDNVMYGDNVETGIKTRAVFSRTYGVTEGDEERIETEYLNPVKMNEIPDDTKGLSYDLVILNSSRQYYSVVKVIVRRDRQVTLVERVHVYKGHLSYKQFHFDLPTNLKGGEHLEFYVRVEDQNGRFLFATLRTRYWINTVPTQE